MTSTMSRPTSTMAPAVFTEQANRMGLPMMSASNYNSGPQFGPNGQVVWSQQPFEFWAPFYGAASKPWIQPTYNSYARQHETLPEAFMGSNAFITKLIMTQITYDDEWPFRVLAPLVVMEDAMEVQMDFIKFDDHMLNRTPEESVSRLTTHTKSSKRDYLVRYGIALLLSHGFMNTEIGKWTYMMNIQQIKNATSETISFGSIWHFLNHKPYVDPNASLRGTGTEQLNDVLRAETDRWGCLHKDALAGIQLRDQLHKTMRDRNQPRGDCLYICEGAMKMFGQKPETRFNFLSGKVYDPNRNELAAQMSDMELVESRSFRIGVGIPNSDPMYQQQTIGGYNLINNRNLTDVPLPFLRTGMFDREVYSEAEDDKVRISYVNDGAFNCGLFDWTDATGENGGMGGGGGDMFDSCNNDNPMSGGPGVDSDHIPYKTAYPITRLGQLYFTLPCNTAVTWGEAYRNVKLLDELCQRMELDLNATDKSVYEKFIKTFDWYPSVNMNNNNNNNAPPPPNDPYYVPAPTSIYPIIGESSSSSSLDGASNNANSNGALPHDENVENTRGDRLESEGLAALIDKSIVEDLVKELPKHNKELGWTFHDTKSVQEWPFNKYISKKCTKFLEGASTPCNQNELVAISESAVVLAAYCHPTVFQFKDADDLSNIQLASWGIGASGVPKDSNKIRGRVFFSLLLSHICNHASSYQDINELNGLVEEMMPSSQPQKVLSLLRASISNKEGNGLWSNTCFDAQRSIFQEAIKEVATYLYVRISSGATGVPVDAIIIKGIEERVNSVLNNGTGVVSSYSSSGFSFLSVNQVPRSVVRGKETLQKIKEAKQDTASNLASIESGYERSRYKENDIRKDMADCITWLNAQNVPDNDIHSFIGKDPLTDSSVDAFDLYAHKLEELILLSDINRITGDKSIASITEGDRDKTKWIILLIAHFYDYLHRRNIKPSYINTLIYLCFSPTNIGNNAPPPTVYREINTAWNSAHREKAYSDETVLLSILKSLYNDESVIETSRKNTLTALKTRVENNRTAENSRDVARLPLNTVHSIPTRDVRITYDEIRTRLLDDVDRFGVKSGLFWDFAMRHNWPQAIGFLLLRPHQTYNMGSAIYTTKGQAGQTAIGHADMELGNDTARKMVHGHFTLYFKTIILAEEKIIIARNIYCNGYIGGNNASFWNAAPGHPDKDDYNQGRMNKSFFSCAVPISYKPKNGTSNLDITGEHHLALEASVSIEPELHYPSAAIYRDHWKWSAGFMNPLNKPYAEEGDSHKPKYNTICFQNFQAEYKWNDAAKAGSFSKYVYNQGHWGRKVGPGFAEVTRGAKAYFDTPGYHDIKATAIIAA